MTPIIDRHWAFGNLKLIGAKVPLGLTLRQFIIHSHQCAIRTIGLPPASLWTRENLGNPAKTCQNMPKLVSELVSRFVDDKKIHPHDKIKINFLHSHQQRIVCPK